EGGARGGQGKIRLAEVEELIGGAVVERDLSVDGARGIGWDDGEVGGDVEILGVLELAADLGVAGGEAVPGKLLRTIEADGALDVEAFELAFDGEAVEAADMRIAAEAAAESCERDAFDREFFTAQLRGSHLRIDVEGLRVGECGREQSGEANSGDIGAFRRDGEGAIGPEAGEADGRAAVGEVVGVEAAIGGVVRTAEPVEDSGGLETAAIEQLEAEDADDIGVGAA